ncbi:MAG: hypothetical protein ACI4V4_01045 [Eubacterium sp.]
MNKKTDKFISKIDRLPQKSVGVFEWVIFAVAAIIAYIFFCHQDILITAGHSVEYLNGHITDFYSACKNTDGEYTANYLPSTFIIFAIWNIPMKILGLAPSQFGDWNIPFMMWNKILPTAAYFASGILIYRLCKDRFGFDNKKSALTMFLTFTTPMAFFTQFLFCQYDIFTVLFMLLGMYYFFKDKPTGKDYLAFALFFGIATTFKYFAFVIFVVLLLLRVKDIFKDILLMASAVLPAGLEALFYLIFDRKAFVKSVFGFSALDYTKGFSVDIGEVSINLMYVFLLVLIAFAYFTKAKDFDELAGYGMFYSCGVCFAFFGMMLWHPQWLMFIVPFWVIGTVINKNHNVLLWIDALFGIVFLVYIANQFRFTLENQGLMRYGILMNSLRYKIAPTLHLSDILVYKDTDTLFSILSAILLIGFIFKHPKFNLKKISAGIEQGRAVINIRFLAFVLVFFVAAFATLPSFADSGDLLWRNYGDGEQVYVNINNETFAEEYTKLDEMEIEKVYVICDTVEESGEKAKIFVDVIDTETNERVAFGEGEEKNIKNGSEKYTQLNLEKSFVSEKDKVYKFRFYTDSDRNVGICCEKSDFTSAGLLRTKQKDYSSSYASYNGEKTADSNIMMKLTGNAVM